MDSPFSDVRWLSSADNPWGVPVLDVSPFTMNMTSTTGNPGCAANLASFHQDDGTSFIGVEPLVTRTIPVGLRFPIDRILADGALFLPTDMEDKWAIYFHRGQLLFIRSWLRLVLVVAQVHPNEDNVEVTSLRGTFVAADEQPSFTVRVLDYLVRSHALDTAYPAPLWPGLEGNPQDAALWCFSQFGNHVQVATPHEFRRTVPESPLRTFSLLHIAIARGDLETAKSLIDAGFPADLLAIDGSAPLHWALVRGETAMIDLLLERGSLIDVRSAEGATPLMNAAQSRSIEMVTFLLDRGADPNATDRGGVTALHRASERGDLQIVKSLLDYGAFARPDAEGHTPESLALRCGHKAIANLLSGR